MSDFLGINQFGSLVSKRTGQKISYEDIKAYDVNSDGNIDESEFNKALKDLQLDSVSFSTINTDGDEKISKEEFARWEQKVQIQNAVNEKLQEISNDAILKQYFNDIKSELKNFMESYINEYSRNVSLMSTRFKAELETKFESIKSEKKANDPTSVVETVLDEIHTSLLKETDSNGTSLIPEEIQAILSGMETVANNFMKTYKGTDFKTDLKTYLDKFFNESDNDRIKEAADNFNAKVAGISGYISGNDFNQIKEAVKTFLNSAIEAGVVIKLGNVNVASTSAITSAIAQYTDGTELLNGMKKAIESVSKEPKKTQIIENARLKLAQQEWQKFANINGSSYQVNSGLLDYSSIEGYYTNDKIKVYNKAKQKEKLKFEYSEIINNSSLKEQMRKQIENMLNEKGVSFDKVANVFENAFSEAMSETLGEITSTRINNKLLDQNKRYQADQGVKDIINSLISKFNNKIVSAIGSLNESNTDFDIVDINFTQLDKTQDEDGNDIGEIKDFNGDNVKGLNSGETLTDAYNSGRVLVTYDYNDDATYYADVAEKIVNGLRSQMLTKAKNMCEANGVEFNLATFNTIFNNAKGSAISESVTGIVKSPETKDYLIGLGISSATSLAGGIAGTLLSGNPIGAVVGTIFGGLSGTGGSILSFLSANKSITLNIRALIDTFTKEFKTNYAQTVEDEKLKLGQ